ncbi:MAG: phenylalanine--tRNA ligase subunit alpha, partial [Phycisphaerae bacterium]|nr:phenylalanine--tRNA ligase subunit alpha [Phycisphaerae bacterium]
MGATERVAEVRQWAEKQLAKAKSLKELQDLRVEVLGRSRGRINQLIKSLRDLAPDERPAFGEAVNRLRTWASQQFATRLAALTEQPATAQQTDVTQPGRRPEIGRIHPITRVRNEMVEIFGRMGFEVAEGPEVEDEWHNFAALNVPAEHPARDPLDNYYISDNVLLRTQTSTVQIRVMENRRPPIRIIAPGRVYRPDTLDAGHSNMFHQLEGLWVDEGVSFADLKSVLTMFAQSFFGPEVRTRFVPSYFPFTEPSAEFYVS